MLMFGQNSVKIQRIFSHFARKIASAPATVLFFFAWANAIYILVCGCLAHKRICEYAPICPNKATCANTRHRRTDVQHLVVTGVRRRSRCARRRARRAAAPRSRSTRAPPPERRVERVERVPRRQGAAEDDRRVEHVAPRCATTECDRTRNAR